MAKAKVTVKRTGGKKLRRLLREAGKGGVSGVKVGFFSTARYEDGTPVAAVAAWNEFGTKNIPERPFFRRAIAEMEDGIANIIKAGIDPRRMTVWQIPSAPTPPDRCRRALPHSESRPMPPAPSPASARS